LSLIVKMAMSVISVSRIRALAEASLLRSGLAPAAAGIVAEVVAFAERDGCHSHGLFRIPGYCSALLSGKVDGHAEPHVVDAAPSLVRVECSSGLAPPAFQAARSLLVSKAKKTGVAVAALKRSCHFSALWYEAETLASKDGLASLIFVNSKAFVAHAPGGTRRVYGTNPIAFGFPRRKRGDVDGGGWSDTPLVFDMASAAMARGEMQVALRDSGASSVLPAGCAIDVDGQPTQDAAAALSGAQLPFGGHKGAALALMVELLAGAATGSPFAVEAHATAALEPDPDANEPTVNGQLVIALDPGMLAGFVGDGMGEEDPMSRAEELFAAVLASGSKPGDVRLPSDRRYARRRRALQDGVLVQDELLEAIEALAGRESDWAGDGYKKN
jgi:delta1-piperideine-2-carboxylate reductase